MATNSEIKAFIKLFSALAIEECNRRIAEGLPFLLPSVCMAQSALESDWGQAGLMKRANAFFGVKAGGSWTGKVYTADTWEVKDGVAYNTVANFRAYDSPADSMRDYYEITCRLTRYSKAWSYGADSSKWLSAKETITALWQGGYATDDLYVNKIMNTINGRNLTEWDKLIDGVSTGVQFNDISFTKADLMQGNLAITDSGRTISNVTGYSRGVALNWDKAITTPGRFKITGIEGFTMHIARLLEDTATIDTTTYENGDFIEIGVEKVGFWLEINADNASNELYLSGVNPDINITFADARTADINTDEGERSALAYFIEITGTISIN